MRLTRMDAVKLRRLLGDEWKVHGLCVVVMGPGAALWLDYDPAQVLLTSRDLPGGAAVWTVPEGDDWHEAAAEWVRARLEPNRR